MTRRPQAQAVRSTTEDARLNTLEPPRVLTQLLSIVLTFFRAEKCKREKRRAAKRRPCHKALISLSVRLETWVTFCTGHMGNTSRQA